MESVVQCRAVQSAREGTHLHVWGRVSLVRPPSLALSLTANKPDGAKGWQEVDRWRRADAERNGARPAPSPNWTPAKKRGGCG